MTRVKVRMEAEKGDMLIMSGENWGLLGFEGSYDRLLICFQLLTLCNYCAQE
jgi:hypothetical protein